MGTIKIVVPSGSLFTLLDLRSTSNTKGHRIESGPLGEQGVVKGCVEMPLTLIVSLLS